MALVSIVHALIKNDPETYKAQESLGLVGCSGVIVIFLVDILWAVVMMFRIAPAWQDVPRSNWEWVDQNITLPWVAPQVVIVIGFFLYLMVWDPPKPYTKV
ncbi:MAG: hypothetical protein AAB839_01820 [Patescibacteria group bacterium]